MRMRLCDMVLAAAGSKPRGAGADAGAGSDLAAWRSWFDGMAVRAESLALEADTARSSPDAAQADALARQFLSFVNDVAGYRDAWEDFTTAISDEAQRLRAQWDNTTRDLHEAIKQGEAAVKAGDDEAARAWAGKATGLAHTAQVNELAFLRFLRDAEAALDAWLAMHRNGLEAGRLVQLLATEARADEATRIAEEALRVAQGANNGFRDATETARRALKLADKPPGWQETAKTIALIVAGGLVLGAGVFGLIQVLK